MHWLESHNQECQLMATWLWLAVCYGRGVGGNPNSLCSPICRVWCQAAMGKLSSIFAAHAHSQRTKRSALPEHLCMKGHLLLGAKFNSLGLLHCLISFCALAHQHWNQRMLYMKVHGDAERIMRGFLTTRNSMRHQRWLLQGLLLIFMVNNEHSVQPSLTQIDPMIID